MPTETRSIAIKAYAKVNLFLNVAGTRSDGYHDLEMFNAKIDLFDDVTIETTATAGAGVTIRSNDKYFENGDNLIVRIARHMLAFYAPGGNVTITIAKRIPAGAGLGGNSADAAAVLRGMDQLFDWNIGTRGLAEIALRFGADIPYCLHSGPAFVFGIGDKILPVGLDLSACGILVVHPQVFVATEAAFAAWDAGNQNHVSTPVIAAAVASGEPEAVFAAMQNALEPATFSISTPTRDLRDAMVRFLGPEGVVMTGSGSTIVKAFVRKTAEIDRFIAENGHKYRIFLQKFANKE